MDMKTATRPTRKTNYADWYQFLIEAAELAEHSPVRGCMIIKPWGCALWENIQSVLDRMFKETGHQNAYFPLFIPLSFLEKEATHVEGFAKECAVVTHHRLEKNAEGRLVPTSPLEEPLIVRPTSEMIIGAAFSKWVNSYRDLPLLINQWANVVRWEMRTRLFLRTTEFLWQEGHTAHATEKEAREETLRMLDVYERFVSSYLAIPVIKGEKTAGERFPGAVNTYTIEAMMQDGKALQAGTSHFLGQNFAKASHIQFQDQNMQQQFAWTTSWGMTTRLIGALIMAHGDDDGVILPPKIAPSHLAILPVVHKEESRSAVLGYCHALAGKLRHLSYNGKPLSVIVDEKEMTGGEKNWAWIKKGVPLRLEIGPREVAQQTVSCARRDRPHSEKTSFSAEVFCAQVASLLDEIQTHLLEKAKAFQNERIHAIHNRKEFYEFFSSESLGFALSFWGEDSVTEEALKKDLGVTARCIPLSETETGPCLFTGKTNARRILFAKAY
jgi:prolyl-tRNA synthetase